MLAFETDIYKKQVDVVKIMQVQQQAHDSAIQEIKTLMEDMAAKNISFEALGVYWLFWGLILSSIPNEILHILKYLTWKWVAFARQRVTFFCLLKRK